MKALPKAPNFNKQDQSGETPVLVYIGSQAWTFAKMPEPLKSQDDALLSNLENPIQFAPPVVITLDTLATIEQYRIAPELTKEIRLYNTNDGNELNAAHFFDLLNNLANNNPNLEKVVRYNESGDYLADVTASVKSLQKGGKLAEVSEETTKLHNINNPKNNPKPLKQIKLLDDGAKSGLFLVETKIQNGQEYESTDFLCTPLDVIGLGLDYDEDKEHFYILQWNAIGDGSEIIEAVPSAEMGQQEGWKMLARKGVNLTFKPRLRLELAEHIQNKAGFAQRWAITSKSGWKNGAYIMPNGDIIGETNNKTPLFLRVKAEKAQYYTTSGSLEEWQQHIARYAVGNSMILLAIACGLAAPIIGILNAANFGLHLFVNSSSGKTISSKLGASLYGHGKFTLSSWKGTDNGIVNEAISHNDGFLVMDELTQIDPKHGKDIAYALFNGEDKTRAKADGGNRKKRHWNVLVLSTGEKDLETQLSETKIHVKAGELVRLINIPFEPFQAFHEFTDSSLSEFEQGKRFAETLEQNSTLYYGTAGRAWVEYLSENRDLIKSSFALYNQKWVDNLPKDKNVSNQIGRIARNFAVLETACQCSRFITGWTEQQISETLQHVFDLWTGNNGYKDREIQQIIETLDGFLSQNLHRFYKKENGYVSEVPNAAGAYIETDKPCYYVFDAVIRDVFKHYNEKTVIKALHNQGRLLKKETGRDKSTIPTEFQKGGYKRAYCILPPTE